MLTSGSSGMTFDQAFFLVLVILMIVFPTLIFVLRAHNKTNLYNKILGWLLIVTSSIIVMFSFVLFIGGAKLVGVYFLTMIISAFILLFSAFLGGISLLDQKKSS